MSRKNSHPAVLNSRAYIQKVVPVHSEMTRSKLLQAEAGLLLERNLSTVLRLQQSEEMCDCNLSWQDSEALPPLMSQEKSYLRSHEPADKSQCKVSTPASLFSFASSNAKELGRLIGRTPRLINRQPQPADDLDYDSGESENPSPEDTYAEYVRTHTLPSDPPLPSLIPAPSASLLQGTVASLRRQSLPTNQSRDTFSSRLQGTIVSQSKQTASLTPNKATARRYKSSTTASPSENFLIKTRYAPTSDVKTPPISLTSTGSSSTINSRGMSQENANSNLYSYSDNTSADSGSPTRNMMLKKGTDYSSRQLDKGVSQRFRTDQIKKDALREPERKASKEFALSSLNRSKFWQVIMMIAIADKTSLYAVILGREAAEMRKSNAIRCIVRFFRRWQAIRFALNCVRKGKVQCFSRLYSKVK